MDTATQRPPLQGMRVLDFTEYGAGPFCTMMLADMGADVIKIERPGGDGFRAWAPKSNGDGSAFMQLNRNKRSMVLDLRRQADRDAARELALKVDVIVENYRPGVMRSLGLPFEQLREEHPQLIYCSISGYGQTGPLKDRGGFDLVLQGHGGLMSVIGEPGGKPSKAGVPIIDFGASAYATIGILAAWIARMQSGKGQQIDVSLLDVPVSWLGLLAAKYWATGEVQQALGSAHPLSAPYQAFATKDGYMTIAAGNQQLWITTCDVLGLHHLIDDARFSDNNARAKNQKELAPLIEAALSTQTSEYWIDRLGPRGVPCGPINTVDQVLKDPQVLHRQMVFEVEDPKRGTLRMIGSPIKLSDTPTEYRRPPPALGEHTSEIIEEFGLTGLAADRALIAQMAGGNPPK